MVATYIWSLILNYDFSYRSFFCQPVRVHSILNFSHAEMSFVKSEQKRSEIQGLMELVLQRSSCDSDPYKER
jgi:hypothetical protein